MAIPVGEGTTAQLVRSFGSHRADSGLRPDRACAKRHARDDSEVGKSLHACICGKKGFTRPSALKRHIKESMEAPKHECPICGHKCKRMGHVQEHLRGMHDKSRDEIKNLLSAQKLQLRQESGPASTAPAAVPRTGPAGVRASFDHPGGMAEVVPGGPWNVPMGVSTTAAPVVQAGASRPGHFSSSALSGPPAAQGPEHVAPAFAPQSLMTQDQELPAYYPAYPAGAVAAAQLEGLPANHAPGSAGYPAALLGGDLGHFDVGAASVTVGPADGGFGMPAPENSFMWDFYGFGLDTFDA